MSPCSFRSRGIGCLMTIVMAMLVCHARIFFVATDGIDSGPGSEVQPWKTVAKAAATLVAGDTVYLRQGTYLERLIPRNSGTQSAPILFAGYPGETVTLDAQGLSGQGIVYCSGIRYVTIARLTVKNGAEAGIWIINSSYITIYGNHTYNTVSSGIIVSELGTNDHIYIDSNDVELACNDGAQECISISKCSFFEVTRNHVHNGGPGTNGGEGIDTKFGSSNGKVCYNVIDHLSRQGLYADAWSMATANLEFYGNIVHDCQFGLGAASETGGRLSSVIFHDNLVYNCLGPGMYLLMSAGPLDSVYFVNNTVHHTGYNWGSGMWFNAPQATNVIVRNNIFSGLSGEPFYIQQAPASWTVDHNLSARNQTGRTGWFIIGTPSYVDTAAHDYHLKKGSLGIDTGSVDVRYATSLGDLEGKNRTVDGDGNGAAQIDLGAYEYQGTTEVCMHGNCVHPVNLFSIAGHSQVLFVNLQGRVIKPAAAFRRSIQPRILLVLWKNTIRQAAFLK